MSDRYYLDELVLKSNLGTSDDLSFLVLDCACSAEAMAWLQEKKKDALLGRLIQKSLECQAKQSFHLSSSMVKY